MLNDPYVFFLINHTWINPVCDWIMALVSNFAFWLPICVILGLWILWKGDAKAKTCLICVICTVLGAELIDGPLKDAIHRARPYQKMKNVRQIELDPHVRPRIFAITKPLHITHSNPLPSVKVRKNNFHSFPSGHTLNNFAVATMVFFFYRRWGWFTYGIACLVSYSRIYVGSHWPSDVLFSAPLGIGIGCIFIMGLVTINKYWFKRPYIPGFHTSAQ